MSHRSSLPRRSRRPGLPRALALAGALAASVLLTSCGGSSDAAPPTPDDDPATTATTTAAAAPTGRCALASTEDLAVLFPAGDPQTPTVDTADRCSWKVVTVGSGVSGRLFLGETSISFDKAVADAEGLGATVTELDGLGDRAAFHTRPELATVIVEADGRVVSADADYGDPSDGGFDHPDDDTVQAILTTLAEAQLPPG